MHRSEKLFLPEDLEEYLGGILDRFESGHLTFLESDDKTLLSKLHHLLVKAVIERWGVVVVDIANCFNPQLISAIAFGTDISSSKVLSSIQLSRSFQIFQAHDIVTNLYKMLEDKQHQLVWVTGLSNQFFDPQLANEDPKFPIPQLEKMRIVIGLLQKIALNNNIVVVSDVVSASRKSDMFNTDGKINPASPRYAGKTHIKIETKEDKRVVDLVRHPYLNPTVSEYRSKLYTPPMPNSGELSRQTALTEFF